MAQVKLDSEIDTYLDELVERGDALSKDDYVNSVLHEQLAGDRIAEQQFWAAVQEGRDDIDAGDYTSVEEAFDIIRREIGLTHPTVK